MLRQAPASLRKNLHPGFAGSFTGRCIYVEQCSIYIKNIWHRAVSTSLFGSPFHGGLSPNNA
jgi:hypothetical protein